MDKSVVLRKEHVGNDSRYLTARITEKGDLSIEGQDFGPAVEELMGPGLREYEWAITVRAANLPKLVTALGGTDGANLLFLLAERFAEDETYASETFLEEHGIPVQFWNRVGE